MQRSLYVGRLSSARTGALHPAAWLGRTLSYLLVLALPLFAQTTGAIQGVVLDSSGAAIPGARVEAVSAATQAQRAATTDGDGRFTLTNLPIGNWTLRLSSPGFATAQTQEFSLSLGQTVNQRFTLNPAMVSEKLEVREQPEAIDVSASNASVALGFDRIEEAPARSRNY